MATIIGARAERVQAARELLSAKGRRAQSRYAFEGPTLLDEALRSGIAIEEIYATQGALQANPRVRELEASGTPVFIVDDRTLQKISDLETPTGLVCVAPMRLSPLERVFGRDIVLVLADINDPGNAGTLMRSAEAFGAGAVVFGSLGVDPYHPKVVRGAMGAGFRLELATATPQAFASAAHAAGRTVFGLDPHGENLRSAGLSAPLALVVGHERRGLGPWEAVCGRRLAIPMPGSSESLNAAVAGSIALYEAAKR